MNKQSDILAPTVPFPFNYLLIPIYIVGFIATTLFLVFQVILMFLRRRVDKFSNKPFFVARSIFAQKEKPIVSFRKWRNYRFKGNVPYKKLNEGFGGAYERMAYTNVLKHLLAKFGGKKVLELNSTFIAGVPAYNSCLLAQAGFDVTVTVHKRDYPDAVLVWKMTGLYDRVKIIQWDDDTKTPFHNNSFDLVWNHLAVEHYKDPTLMLAEMRRLSRNLVVTMTLSPWNLGFMLHFLWHTMTGKQWDHGIIKNTLISTMEKYHRRARLRVVESGGCDDPMHMDTVDSKMGESMTYLDSLPRAIRDAWVWTAINPTTQTHPLTRVSWFLERGYPEWFRRYTAHHLYTASMKKA